MKKPIQRKFIIAFNLILTVLVLSAVWLFLPDTEIMAGGRPIIISVNVLMLVVGFQVRQGYNWARFAVLFLALLSSLRLPSLLMELQYFTIGNVVEAIQIVLMLCAVIILFMPSKASV